MPFQVTYSQRLVQVNAVQSVNAGKDANAVCDVSFSLTATVNGNIAGHTLLWEQISGTAVTFTTPVDQLSISYNQSTFDDKTFRFYVDKGQARERYDDVTVFGSPTSNNVIANPSTRWFSLNSTDDVNGDQVALKLITPWPTAPHGGVSVKGSYTSAVLLWNTSPTNYTILGFVIKERNNTTGVWSDLAVVSPTDRFFDGITIGNSYQICIIFQYPNSHIAQVPSNIVWISGSIDSGLIAVDVTIPSFSSSISDTNNFTVLTLALTAKLFTDSHVGSTISNADGIIDDFTVLTLALTAKILPFDSHVGSTISNSVGIVDAYDVLVLTGSQVGG